MKAISQGLAIPDDRCGEVSDLQCIYVSYRKRSDDPATQPLCCRIPLEGAGADTHQPSTSVIGTRSFAPSGVGCAGQAGSPTPPCVFLLHTCMLQSIPEYATTRLLFSHLCTAPSTGTHRHTHSSGNAHTVPRPRLTPRAMGCRVRMRACVCSAVCAFNIVRMAVRVCGACTGAA